MIGKTETKNGVTYKINEDCSITVNGTPTDYTSFNLLNMSLKAGTYKFTDGLNSNNVFLQTLGNFQETSQNNTFSLAEDGKATVYLVILVGAPTLNNATLYPMIYEGTEDKPYEQYGVSPSPDYPSEIKTVGSNENLLENKAITQTINGVTFTVNKDGSIMANGTATTNTTFKINNDIVPKNISNLILSGCPNNGSESTYDLKIELYKNSVWTKVLYDFGNGVDTGDLSEYTSCKISITIRKDYNANNLIFKPKLEKGSKVTPYSTYRMGSVGIDVVNKNLLDKNLIDRNISYTYGIIGEVPKPQKGLNYRGTLSVENAIEIKPNTNYVITVPPGIKFAVAQLESNLKSLGDTGWLLSTKSPYIVTTQHNAKYIAFNFGKDDNSNFTDSEWDSFINGYLQLEAGTTATDFVEHQSQSAIMPVQKEMLQGDYFDFDNEEEVHVWNKLIFDENSDIECTHAEQGTFQFRFLKQVDGNALSKVICNMSSYWRNLWGENGCFVSYNGYFCILCKENEFGFNADMTTDEAIAHFKEILANNKLIAYYQLTTPICLPFTDEQKAVAKELNNARTYKNVTNITTDSKAILSLDYAKDLETLLTSKESEV